jgi:hypothetical protein
MIANDIDQPNTLFPRLNVNNVPQEPSTECCSQQRNGAAVHTIHLGVSQGAIFQVFWARFPIALQAVSCKTLLNASEFLTSPYIFGHLGYSWLFHHKLDDSSQLMTIPKLEMLTMLACEHRGCGCMKTAAQVRLLATTWRIIPLSNG